VKVNSFFYYYLDANLCTIHEKRVTLMTSDIRLARKLRESAYYMTPMEQDSEGETARRERLRGTQGSA
jgi:hypothetical protein